MTVLLFILKLLLKIIMAPVLLALTLIVWIGTGIMYLSGLILGLFSMLITVLGLLVLILDSPKNGIIALVIAFLISPYGLPIAVFWLLGKVLELKYIIQDWMYGL